MGEVLTGSVSPQDEQTRFLQDSSNNVKRSGFYMKRALEDDNLREALRYSAAMLGELRTSFLTPQKYFELYMQVFDELRYLEAFFKEEHKKGRSYADLYELVQHAGNVLPRLYLLCTVGSCFIRSKEANAKDILKDLVEMCKGVQHPTRGLFLRSYLCQVSRGLLPDAGSEFEGEGGNISDALDFLLLNFTEMNKLWVRMQHQGSNRDKERREKERQQLADLVGKNLTYISQLEGLDFALYNSTVQPRVVEQVVACKDDIAQQYLMQCIIQGYPDDFHVGTLDALLGTLPHLQPGVKVHVVLASLLDRLARYASTDDKVLEAFETVDAFKKLKIAATEVASQHAEMPVADVAAMFIALARFTGAVYPDRLDYVDSVLTSCYKALESRGSSTDARAVKQLTALLTIPLDTYDVVTVLSLASYPSVMNLLPVETQKEMAVKIVQTILKQDTSVGSLEKVDMLFNFIAPLVQEVEGLGEEDAEDFAEEQGLVARLMHQLRSDDTDETFAVLKAARERLAASGPQRLRHTLPPLAFNALKLTPKIRARELAGEELEATCKTILQFIHTIAAVLADTGAPGTAEMALHLFLTATHTSSELAGLELITYEFFEQAFIIYEENIPDSSSEKTALHSIVGALQHCTVLSPESRSTLVHKATGYSAKLLKKADQCRAVCACSHLFWQPQREQGASEDGGGDRPGPASTSGESPQAQAPVRDADSIMTCLKRALKIAHATQQQLAVAMKTRDTTAVHLFVEILNHYVYYFDQGLPTISAAVLQNLLELVANEMALEHCQADRSLVMFYDNTLKHIQAQKDKEGSEGERYRDVQL